MNIAEQIKQFHTGQEAIEYQEFVSECESKAVDVEQDFDAESTLYEFADGSVLVWSGAEIHTFGCRD